MPKKKTKRKPSRQAQKATTAKPASLSPSPNSPGWLGALAPVEKNESPRWFYFWGRLLLSLFILTMPVMYDTVVPEVAGDPRWMTLHSLMLLLIALFFVHMYQKCKAGAVLFPKKLSLSVSSWAVVLMALAGIFSVTHALNPHWADWNLRHHLGYCLLFGFIVYLRHPRWFAIFPWLIALPVAINSVIGIAQFLDLRETPFLGWLVHYFRYSAPPAGTLANKNLAASYMVLTLPVVFYLFLASKRWWPKICAAVILMLGLTFLIYTRSRGSWLAAVAMLVFAAGWTLFHAPTREAFLQLIRTDWKRQFALLWLLLGSVLAASSAQSPLTNYHSMDTTVAQQTQSLVHMSGNDVGPRLAYNMNGIKMFLDAPLMGIGLGSFHGMYPKYHDAWHPTPLHGYSVEARPQRVHNDILQMFIETGVFGGMGLLLLFVTPLWMVWRLGKKLETPKERFMAASFLFGIAGLGVNALGDFPLQMPTAPILLMVFAAVLTGLYRARLPNAVYSLPLPSFISVFLPRRALPLFCAFTLAGLGFLSVDNYYRRESGKHMKLVMGYAISGYFNDKVFHSMKEAERLYPRHERIPEFKATVYANFKGSTPISNRTKIKVIEDAARYDPYAANVLINLGGVYMAEGMHAKKAGDAVSTKAYADRIWEIYKQLAHLAPFSPHTEALGGYARFLQDNPEQAVGHFIKSLKVDKVYTPSLGGLQKAQAALLEKGYTPQDIQYLQMLGENKIPVGLKLSKVFRKQMGKETSSQKTVPQASLPQK